LILDEETIIGSDVLEHTVLRLILTFVGITAQPRRHKACDCR